MKDTMAAALSGLVAGVVLMLLIAIMWVGTQRMQYCMALRDLAREPERISFKWTGIGKCKIELSDGLVTDVDDVEYRLPEEWKNR